MNHDKLPPFPQQLSNILPDWRLELSIDSM